MTFVAENVRARRQAAGLNQKGLAEASGVSLRMIGAIEGGTTSASTATLDRIGMALDATPQASTSRRTATLQRSVPVPPCSPVQPSWSTTVLRGRAAGP